MLQKPILLVEDNPDDEKLTLRALKRNNIVNPVTVAHDGAEALDMLVGEKARPFGLILLDLRLPKLHGLKILERLRADDKAKLTPVVVLTSSKEEADLIKSYSLGANSFIRKPVDFQKFAEAVGQLGMYWLMLNEPPPVAFAEPLAASA
jgi:two-component system response regulator